MSKREKQGLKIKTDSFKVITSLTSACLLFALWRFQKLNLRHDIFQDFDKSL